MKAKREALKQETARSVTPQYQNFIAEGQINHKLQKWPKISNNPRSQLLFVRYSGPEFSALSHQMVPKQAKRIWLVSKSVFEGVGDGVVGGL
ncbi:unnamed protein product [Cercopithifilaria johnstoni]|uniref:Uncharacterized protein n=1 Tax=Cercopithifilaria johnstoni TaxID=2874296 RepID=A0A8J2LRH6_9BILA|nr:unnamed protein product [Cercopithifilaria johnstoni]